MKKQYNYKSFDERLAYHCSPALAGIKPSNLVCIRKKEIPNLKYLLHEYNKKMNNHDIFFKIVKNCESSSLVFVYKERKLKEYLQDKKSTEFLTNEGYTKSEDPDHYIEQLKSRLESDCDFPNEIGIFLGYPHEDVYAFIEKKGKNSLLSRYWKVYNDKNEAEKTFIKYDKCIDAICERV